MERTLYCIYFNKEQNKMLRYDNNADDDDRISYGDIPRESFFETYFETYKEGFYHRDVAYDWQGVKRSFIFEYANNKLINLLQGEDPFYILPTDTSLKLVRAMCEVLDPEALKKVDIDYPDERIKKLWDDAEVFDIIAWCLNEKNKGE